MTAQIGDNLQRILTRFSQRKEVSADAYQAIITALEKSPVLTAELNAAADGGGLLSFDILPASSNAGAQFGNGTLQLKVSQIGIPSSSEADLIFQIGHETQHALNAGDTDKAWATFSSDVTSLAKSSSPQDYTQILEALQAQEGRDEATAQISGWNAYVDYVNHITPAGQAPDYTGSFYSQFFISKNGTPVEGIAFGKNADGTVNYFVDPKIESNVIAERNAYFYQQDTTHLGQNGNEDYPSYYAGNAVSKIAREVAAEGKSDFSIDLGAMHIDPVQLQQELNSEPKNINPISFTDSRTNSFLTYDLGGTNNLTVKQPFYIENGSGMNQSVFNPAGKLTLNINSQNNNLTGTVTTTIDNYGTSGRITSEVVTETDSSTNFLLKKSESIFNDSGRLVSEIKNVADPVTGGITTTKTSNSYDSAGDLATQVQSQSDPITGTTATTTINYNPGPDQTQCTFTTQVTQTGFPQVVLSEVSGTETVSGQVLTAYVSGSAANVYADGATISLANNTVASIVANPNSNNTIQTPAGQISVQGNSTISRNADGTSVSIKNSAGDLQTTVETTPATSTNPLVVTRIDYMDSSDNNVRFIRTYDASGNIISSTNVTRAFDNAAGSPTYGQPVANTYNIVNEDSNGKITSTGQREVSPDGSYQDTLIGSATAANPDGTIQVDHVDSNGNTTPVVNQTGVLSLSNQISALNDAYTLVKAIQSGQPLPIVSSGLHLANDLSNGNLPALNMAGNAVSVVSDIEGMAAALRKGDVASSIYYGANTFVQGVNLYTSIVYKGDLINAAGDGFGDIAGLANTVGDALPYIKVAYDLIRGDKQAVLGDVIGTYAAEVMSEVGSEIGSAAGPIGALAGFVVGSVIGDLFGDDPPEPWGSASVGWNPDGSYRVDAVGDAGGDQTARNVLGSLVGGLQNIANQYNNLGQPGLQLGIIPERLGTLSYDTHFTDGTFHVNTVDAVTGQQINPDLSFDKNGNVTLGSTYDGNDAYFQNLSSYYINNALAREAIAPQWEVKTAQMQAQAGLSNAGLTETQRAANLGELASPISADSTVETWNPIALDFGGGLATTSLNGSSVEFNVDGTDNLDANLTGSKDTQYLHQTAWLNKTDGFLVLDENLNGAIDNGEEMFSDSQVATGYRGISSLATYDANGDGVINSIDPVFSQLGIWIDTQGTGRMTSSSYHSLASLGIASLNYRLGTYTKTDGSVHEMGTLSLQAATLGTSYAAAPNGIQLTTTSGQVTLEVTRLNDLSTVQANELGFATDEDVAAVIQVRGNGNSIQGLLDTDKVSNAPNAILQLQSVENAQGGTVSYNAQSGTVIFTPTTGFSGTAGFDYTINAGAYGTATAHVQVNVAQVDHPPVITGNTLQQIPIYGYEYVLDSNGNGAYVPLYQPGAGYGDATGGGGYGYRSTAVTYQTNPDAGTLSVTDKDFSTSALTWTVLNQARYGNASVDAHGNWSFSPTSAIGGTDAFVVQVRDPLGGTSQYTVSVPLPSPPPPPPSGGGDGGGGDAGQSDDSDSDSDGDADGDGGGDGGGGDGGDPLILDLKGNGFHFTSVNDSNVFFEQSADGLRHQSAWFSGGNGVLAYNKYGDGSVRDSSQIDFYKQVTGATNDLQALQLLAGGARQLDASSSVWSKLGVWVDANANGQSETGEFETLSQLGIKSINFTDTPAFSVQNGVVIHEMATFTYVDGTTENMAEVTLPFSNEVLAGTKVTQVEQGSLAKPITAGDGNNLILGNSGDNAVSAGNGNNVVITGAGNDLIHVGDGNNSIQSGDGNDLIVAGNGNNAILLGGGPKTVVVGAGANTVIGGNGNNIIMAGEGNNVLYAGSGNSVVFAEDGNNTLVGGIGHNELIAGNGNNSFTDGGGIADMTAGTGSNTFVVNNTRDSITVAAPVAGTSAGVNTVKSSVNWTLGANQKILWGTGNSALTLTGNSTGDQIIGNGAADTLIGGGGNDTIADSGGAAQMIGGGGNDTFVVSNTASVVQETANSGIATIKTSVSYSLPDNVQNLIGTGNAALILRGGAQDGTTITANDANDTLIAGNGVSSLIGGAGSDTFVVNNVNDVVHAQAGGINTVQTSVNYTAGVHVQNLVGTGAADLILTGNGAGDTVQANAGNDTLIAATGTDRFIGGSGNDTYQLGDGNESVLLGTGGSIVTGGRANAVVNGRARGVANITLGDGQVQIDLSQNNQANVISLGDGADSVSAGNGNNTISVGNGRDLITTGDGNNLVNAGNGNDAITVGNGNNRIAIGSGTNQVTVGTGTDVVTNWNGNDTLLLEQNVPADTVNFANLGNDIQINESLNNGSVRVVGASATPSSALGQYVLGNGNDTVSLDASSYHIRAGNGNDVITGLDASETLSLGNGNSQVTLGNGSNQVTVGNGNNTLSFGNGGNSIVNGAGNNLIRFGAGSNSLTNNGGFDQVTFDAGSNGGIVNYTVSGQDVIVGSPSWANGGSVRVINAQSSGAGTTEFVFDNSSYDVGFGTANAGFKAGNGNNTVMGADGNDLVDLGNGVNYVQLGNGNDKVTTSDLSYVTNTIMLGNGNDQVQIGDGNNYVSVGSGINTLTGGDGNNDFALGAGRNQLNLGNGNNSVVLDQGLDQLTLGNGNNTVKGNESAGISKTVVAGNGNDQIFLGQGDDTLSLGSGSLTVTLGDGRDSIHAHDIATSTSSITVGNGADTITLGDGADNIYLGNGNDQVSAGNGNDQVYGGSGNSQVSLGNGNSTVSLGDGNNKISLGDGNNVVDLGNGNNVLSVGNGNNTINLNGNAGSDILILGNGADTVSSSGSTQDYQLGSGQYVINNWSGQDNITLTTANASQLWFQQQNGDLDITVLGSNESVKLTNWFYGSAASSITTADGATIDDATVANLVQAMAAFSPPSPGQTSYTAAEQSAIEPLLASSRH
ncbi:beta strand repeat-containing protein [Herbaspirillum huttiense]|uniref:beta strand repeat-containing protein n=1 Tax=Herbaspirillum huttiense TaxID=863372 RepID=UPI0031D679DF